MVTDVEIIKAFAEEWGFFFNLTRTVEDFNNLIDDQFKGYYIFLAQNSMNPTKENDESFSTDEVFTGKMFICTPSNIDGVLIDHNGDFDKFLNVKKIYRIKPWLLLDRFNCPAEVKITTSNVKPFYNWQNINYDGVVLDYVIRFDNIQLKLTETEIRNIIANE